MSEFSPPLVHAATADSIVEDGIPPHTLMQSFTIAASIVLVVPAVVAMLVSVYFSGFTTPFTVRSQTLGGVFDTQHWATALLFYLLIVGYYVALCVCVAHISFRRAFEGRVWTIAVLVLACVMPISGVLTYVLAGSQSAAWSAFVFLACGAVGSAALIALIVTGTQFSPRPALKIDHDDEYDDEAEMQRYASVAVGMSALACAILIGVSVILALQLWKAGV